MMFYQALLQMLEEGKIKGIVYDKIYQYVFFFSSSSFSTISDHHSLYFLFLVIVRGLESVPEGLNALGSRETWGKAVVKVSKATTKL